MKADRKVLFRKGALCLAALITAAAFMNAEPVMAADNGRWGQAVLSLGLIEDEDQRDHSYDLEDDLNMADADGDEAEEQAGETDPEAQDTAEETEAAEETEETEETEEDDNGLLTKEEFEALDWTCLATADVDKYLNVRADADADAEVIGRIYAGAVVTVLSTDEEWTKISSGNVEGYAATDYLLFGEEAEALSDELVSPTVIITADSVRIRSSQSTDSTVITKADEGDELTWDPEAEVSDGWVAVTYDDRTCYVSADFAQTGWKLDTALTSEEAKEYESANYSASDLDLLAALIFCEAGGECYAGQLAVGAVVVNRVRSSSYPNTISGVIYQSGQFSPASSGWLSTVLSSGKATSSCYAAAKEALSGVSNVGSCLHFHAGSGSGTQIGNQVFY